DSLQLLLSRDSGKTYSPLQTLANTGSATIVPPQQINSRTVRLKLRGSQQSAESDLFAILPLHTITGRINVTQENVTITSSGPLETRTRSDRAGNFSLTGLPQGTYKLHAAFQGYGSDTLSVPADTADTVHLPIHYPHPVLSRESLSVSLSDSMTITDSLHISNAGTLPLQIHTRMAPRSRKDTLPNLLETFEDALGSRWDTTYTKGHTITLTQDTPYHGNSALRLTGGYPHSSGEGPILRLGDDLSPSVFSYRVRSASAQRNDASMRMGEVNTAIAKVTFAENGQIQVNDADLCPYEADRWYGIRLTMNHRSSTFDIEVDDSCVARNIPFLFSSPGTVEKIYFYNRDSSCSDWDNIRLDYDWVDAEPFSKEILPGDSSSLAALFRGHLLAPGFYEKDMRIQTNAPGKLSHLSLPVQLSLGEVSGISALRDTVDFDTVYQNFSDTVEILLQNTGNTATMVDSLRIGPYRSQGLHLLTDGPLELPPFGETVPVRLAYIPRDTGWSRGKLELYGKGESVPQHEVPLRGYCRKAPYIVANRDSITHITSYSPLPSGTAGKQHDRLSFSLANTGMEPLEYSISSALKSRSEPSLFYGFENDSIPLSTTVPSATYLDSADALSGSASLCMTREGTLSIIPAAPVRMRVFRLSLDSLHATARITFFMNTEKMNIDIRNTRQAWRVSGDTLSGSYSNPVLPLQIRFDYARKEYEIMANDSLLMDRIPLKGMQKIDSVQIYNTAGGMRLDNILLRESLTELSPLTGTLPAGSEEDIRMRIDKKGFLDGTEKDTLIIASNAINHDTLRIPLHIRGIEGLTFSDSSHTITPFRPGRVHPVMVENRTYQWISADSAISSIPFCTPTAIPGSLIPPHSSCPIYINHAPGPDALPREGHLLLFSNEHCDTANIRFNDAPGPPLSVTPSLLTDTLMEHTRFCDSFTIVNHDTAAHTLVLQEEALGTNTPSTTTPYLTDLPGEITIPPKDSLRIPLTIDKQRLTPLPIHRVISVTDRANPSRRIPFHLSLRRKSGPSLFVSPDTLTATVREDSGGAATMLQLQNTGTEDLRILDIFSTDDAFRTSFTTQYAPAWIIAPGEKTWFSVGTRFLSPGDTLQDFFIRSNDTTDSLHRVYLRPAVQAPAEISLSDSLLTLTAAVPDETEPPVSRDSLQITSHGETPADLRIIPRALNPADTLHTVSSPAYFDFAAGFGLCSLSTSYDNQVSLFSPTGTPGDSALEIFHSGGILHVPLSPNYPRTLSFQFLPQTKNYGLSLIAISEDSTRRQLFEISHRFGIVSDSDTLPLFAQPGRWNTLAFTLIPERNTLHCRFNGSEEALKLYADMFRPGVKITELLFKTTESGQRIGLDDISLGSRFPAVRPQILHMDPGDRQTAAVSYTAFEHSLPGTFRTIFDIMEGPFRRGTFSADLTIPPVDSALIVSQDLDFGTLEMGELCHRTCSLENHSNDTLELRSFDIQGGSFFSVPQKFPVRIPPDRGARIPIIFQPTSRIQDTALGIATMTLRDTVIIQDTISLAGTGRGPAALRFFPDRIVSTIVPGGDTLRQSFAVTNPSKLNHSTKHRSALTIPLSVRDSQVTYRGRNYPLRLNADDYTCTHATYEWNARPDSAGKIAFPKDMPVRRALSRPFLFEDSLYQHIYIYPEGFIAFDSASDGDIPHKTVSALHHFVKDPPTAYPLITDSSSIWLYHDTAGAVLEVFNVRTKHDTPDLPRNHFRIHLDSGGDIRIMYQYCQMHNVANKWAHTLRNWFGINLLDITEALCMIPPMNTNPKYTGYRLQRSSSIASIQHNGVSVAGGETAFAILTGAAPDTASQGCYPLEISTYHAIDTLPNPHITPCTLYVDTAVTMDRLELTMDSAYSRTYSLSPEGMLYIRRSEKQYIGVSLDEYNEDLPHFYRWLTRGGITEIARPDSAVTSVTTAGNCRIEAIFEKPEGIHDTLPRLPESVLSIRRNPALLSEGRADIHIRLKKEVVQGKLIVVDPLGNTLFSTDLAPGHSPVRHITWNLRNRSGRRAAPGTYALFLKVRCADGTGGWARSLLGVEAE
ncbi:MAG: carboxypeptidase-like regulatory domain-containing protein, partial [Fibrobacterota bacterium]